MMCVMIVMWLGRKPRLNSLCPYARLGCALAITTEL